MNLDRHGAHSGAGNWFMVTLATALVLGSLAFFAFSEHQSASASSDPPRALIVSSSNFGDGQIIPQRYTCDGNNVSPELHWSPVPEGTKSLALVMHDPDAALDFTHWLAFNIAPAVRQLTEGASSEGAMPPGSTEGVNGFGRKGYGGPCPPAGRPHHYVFQLYALDNRLDLPPAAERGLLESAMKQHIIARGQVTGLYGR